MRGPSNAAARRKSTPLAVEAPSTGIYRRVDEHDVAPLVLIVDDAEETRAMYAEFFEHSGMRVCQATDGEHALWKVLSLMPDVVVMDLAMPTLDGAAATREIKAHGKSKHIPVIVLTGHATATAIAQAEQAGADVVLVKPCTPSVLFAIVRRFVDR